MATEIEVAVKAALEADKAAAAAKEAEKAAMKASIVEELKGKPEYRAMFNVKKETAGVKLTPDEAKRGLTIEDKKETHEYIWRLRHPLTLPADMRVHGVDDYAMRGMEETEATEGLPLVPQDMLNRIWEIRDAVSLVRRSGITPYQTNRLIFNVPREVTPMIALAAIAEEGAYIEDTPNLSLVPVTVGKYGCFVDASEELLEDQDLFSAWFTRACGRAWGLAENILLGTVLGAVNGVEIAVAGAPSDGEILAWYYALSQEYRDGAVMFMNDSTLAYLRSMLLATPRAYGEFGFSAFGTLGDGTETFLGKRVFANANWPTMAAAGAGVTYASFVNTAECLAWVERRGLVIKVDPYTKMVNGLVGYYPSARFCAVVIQATAISNSEDQG